MKLYYYKSKNGNFGDDINMWLWDRVLPFKLDDTSDEWLSVIGSLINSDMPKGSKKTVFSSGAGCGHAPTSFGGDDWNILCVRGPLTEKVFNLPQGTGVTDGAILLGLLDECAPVDEKDRSGVVFMPHHSSLSYADWPAICEKAGIDYISPSEDSHSTIQKLRYAKLVIADAMHAAIVADTLRVPWVPVQATPEPNDFKWTDWCLSMNLEYRPIKIPSSSMKEAITRLIFKGYYPSGRTPEEIAKNYQSKMMGEKDTKWVYERKARRAASKTARRLYDVIGRTGLFKGLENSIKNKAVKSLVKLSNSDGYLSDDRVFNEKLKAMENKMREIT